MALIEVDGCIYDETQFGLSHGYGSLDPVAREAFVNHMHLEGDDRALIAGRIIESWASEMRLRWPGRGFRIYKDERLDEVIVRFHLVRTDLSNWSDEGVEIIEVGITVP